MSGLELLVAARTVRPHLPVVVATAYGSVEVRDEIRRSGRVEYLEKPFPTRTLIEAIDRLVQEVPAGFSGAISLPMLPDLIQLHAVSGTSGALRITRSGEEGMLWFSYGRMVHARCGALTGSEAVYKLLTWGGGQFIIEPAAVAPEHTIATPWQALLLEGCRRMDEIGRTPHPVSTATGSPPPVHEWRSALPPSDSEGLHLSIARDPKSPRGRQEAPVPPVLAEAVRTVVQIARVLGGETEVDAVECVGPEVGIAILWDESSEATLLMGDTLGSETIGRALFRSRVARWLAEGRAVLAEQAPRDTSA